MNGKRVRAFRKAARQTLGPAALDVDYEWKEQRSATGGIVARAVYTRPDPVTGKELPVEARVRAEYFDIGRWRWAACWIRTGLPIFRTYGLEPRLTLSCVKGLAARFKDKYRRITHG